MIEGLKPYPKMKPSGVEWLGDVPAHWEVTRLKHACTRIVGGATPASGTPGYWDGNVTWVTPTDVSRRARLSSSLRQITEAGLRACSATLIPAGSVIITTRAPVGNVAIAEVALCTNQGCKALLPDPSCLLDGTLLFQILGVMTAELQSLATGTTFAELSTSKLGAAAIPVAPLGEQPSMVRFLAHADRLIGRYIRVKQALIKLLEEQKQAVIHRAVTRGLDPNVRLKPSGIDWLDDVPEHWDVKPLKHYVPGVTVGIVVQPARLYVPSGVPCLRSLNISSGVIDTTNLVFISSESNAAHMKSQLHTGDIVVVRTGRAGVAVVVPEQFDAANCVDLLIIRRSTAFLSEYLTTYLNSPAARIDIEGKSVGAIQGHYNTGTLANLIVPAPTVVEQREILDALRRCLGPLDRTISDAKAEIALLREYRTRLITDVVTGKLDVREAASSLPEELEFEPSSAEILDEVEDSADEPPEDELEEEVA